MKTTVRWLALVFTLVSAQAFAAKGPTPEERALKFRESVFQGMAWKMGTLARSAAMGNKEEFAKQAEAMAFYATQIQEGFIPNSIVGDSEALPVIWEDMDAFIAQSEKFASAVAELTTANYDIKSFNAREFGSKNCGGCHRKFKKKD